MPEIRQGFTKTYRRVEGFQSGKQRFCSYDRHPLPTDADGNRIEVPIVDRFDVEKNKYAAYRAACSPACAKAYIIEQRGADTALRLMWQRQMLIDEAEWPHDKPIPQARSWEEIEGNLGDVPIDEWRATAGDLGTTVCPAAVVPYDVFLAEEHAAPPDLQQDVLDSFTLEGLARPPDELNVKTTEEFLAKYPGHVSDDPGEFARWLERAEKPTDEECERLQREFIEQRNDKRKSKAAEKRKATAATGAASKKKAKAKA